MIFADMSKPTILIAEDDDILRKSLAFFLGNHGYGIIEIDNGSDAAEAIRSTRFDLIITDLNMPYIGGMELIHIVRNELKLETPVIVLTASGVEKTELDAFAIGASEFMGKPFSPSVLEVRVRKLLGRTNAEN